MRWRLHSRLLALVVACLWLISVKRFLWRPLTELFAQADDVILAEVAAIADNTDHVNHKQCETYDGVLLIQQGDVEGAAGTIFYLFILNQLQYAERYNLLPFIHLNNASRWVYYESEEDVDSSQNRSYTMLSGWVSENEVHDALTSAVLLNRSTGRETSPQNHSQHSHCPGKPNQSQPTKRQSFTLYPGEGVWNTYFQPVNSYHPISNPCPHLALITLSPLQILQGLHLQCDWSVRAWKYGGMTEHLLQNATGSVNEWLEPQRLRAAQFVRRYYRPRRWLQEAAAQANPSQQCLAMHVRHSDKGNRRKRIKLQAFLPYVQTYLQVYPDATIYLSTDSTLVYPRVQELWPADVASKIRMQENVLRSSNTSAVFQLVADRNQHLTNTQVLTDILAMAKCQILLHGLSAVSEAVLYHKVEMISVNLEDGSQYRMSLEEFGRRLRSNLLSLNVL